MPGKWILDDSQSLFYLDDEDDVPCKSATQPVEPLATLYLQRPRKSVQALSLPSRSAGAREALYHAPTLPNRPYREYGLASDLVTGYDEVGQRDLLQQSMLKRKRTGSQSIDTILLDRSFSHPLTGMNLVMGYNTSLPTSRLDVYITAMRQLIRGCSERSVLA